MLSLSAPGEPMFIVTNGETTVIKHGDSMGHTEEQLKSYTTYYYNDSDRHLEGVGWYVWKRLNDYDSGYIKANISEEELLSIVMKAQIKN